jgi:hypothetical protein
MQGETAGAPTPGVVRGKARQRKPTGNRKSRRTKATVAMADYEQKLEDPKVIAAWKWPAKQVRREKSRVRREKARLRGKVVEEGGGLRGGLCPSDPWFEANWFHRAPFPPGGDNSLMRRCKVCGSYVPPQAITSSGACDDCLLSSMSPQQLERLPSSAGVVDMGRLKASRQRGEDYTRYER